LVVTTADYESRCFSLIRQLAESRRQTTMAQFLQSRRKIYLSRLQVPIAPKIRMFDFRSDFDALQNKIIMILLLV
jgi:hypothetical protein